MVTRERERERGVEKGEKAKGEKNKIYYFGLQLCYSAIIHLGWHYSTLARPCNGLFLYLDAKIYQNMAYGKPSVNVFTTNC